jgi:putative GTP pyrophosphokinase
MAYFSQSKYKEAINDFTLALELDPQSSRTAYYRGVVYSVLREFSKAVDDFSRSLKLNPYQAFCRLRRGQAYYHLGDLTQALCDCEDAISLEPNNETAESFRALVKSKLKM